MKRRVTAALGLCAASLAHGCGTTQRATATARPGAPDDGARRAAPNSTAAAPFGAPDAGVDAAPLSDQLATEAVQRALTVVSALRGLSPTEPVRGRVVSRAALLAHAKTVMSEGVPPEAIRGQAEFLVALRVVPPDFDLEQSVLDLMGAQLAGLYEPKDKTMYLAGDLASSEAKATLSHELVHALQDQHYGLGKLIEYRPDSGDEQSAIHALAEGDATSAMLDDLLLVSGKTAIALSDEVISAQAGALEISPGVARIPTIIKRSLIAPYVDGTLLVHWARRRGGWPAVDAIWARPPSTTEQVLHPEKLDPREPGQSVGVPPAPSGFAGAAFHDVFGEQSLRLVFEEWMPIRTAVECATDWGGDRGAIFVDGDRVALAWHLRFDRNAAAGRALEAFARGILRLDDETVERAAAAKAIAHGALCREHETGAFAAVLRGRDVAITIGPFRHNSGRVSPESGCALALRWAARVATSK